MKTFKFYTRENGLFFKCHRRGNYLLGTDGETVYFLFKSGEYEKSFTTHSGFLYWNDWKETKYPKDWPALPVEISNRQTMNKIYTKFDKSAAPLVEKLVKERNMIYTNYNPENWYLGCGPCQSFDHIPCPGNHEDYKEVPLIEFLTTLAALPFKPKIINILPWKIEVFAETVNIGCQKDVSKASFQELIEGMETLEGEEFVYLNGEGFKVKVSRSGFRADGAFVPWETWDRFKAEYRKV